MQLPCIKCGEMAANLTLDLADGQTVHCTECDADFSTEDVRLLVVKWNKALRWIDAMPTQAEIDGETVAEPKAVMEF